MTIDPRFQCPNGCAAGYRVRDGRNLCVECGTPVVRPGQRLLGDYE